MSRITRVLLPAVFIIALSGVAASSALAVEDPFYKAGGARLGAGVPKEVELRAEGNQILKSPGAGITITCTGVATKAGATIIGSAMGEPGTSSGVIEYSGCTVAGNGMKCAVSGGKITTNPLKDELVLNAEAPVKGTKLLDLFKPVEVENEKKEKKVPPFVTVKFAAEAGGECKFTETSVEGSVDVAILNSKKLTVAQEENEAEEEFGFIKALANGTKECKLKEGTLDKCVTSSLKAFGVASTLEGTAEAFLDKRNAKGEVERTKEVFGVFTK